MRRPHAGPGADISPMPVLSLRDMRKFDVESDQTFFSDFAGPHHITCPAHPDGITMDCVVNSSRIGEFKRSVVGRTVGMNAKDVERTISPAYTDTTVIMVRTSDFGPRPARGCMVRLDGRRYKVISCEGDSMYTITMEENRV